MTDDLSATLGRIAQDVSSANDFPETVDRLIAYACDQVGATDAGMTLIRGARLKTVGATSDRVEKADEAQYEAGEGPCIDAATQSRTIWSDNLATDDRWPVWGPRAANLGFGSILSTDLYASGRRLGALNLYGKSYAEFDVDNAAVAHLFAQHAAVALSYARQVDDLHVALETRNLIGQAQGILMARHHIDSTTAFSVLRRYSQDSNTKLSAVAERFIRTNHLAPGHRADDQEPDV